jgi:acyl-CoA reductase-like NAD-dependent aldehyde dehydrogenase
VPNALDRLNAYVTHKTDEDQAEFARRVAARDAEVLNQAVAKLRERAGELSELAEEKMSRALEERAQEWHEAADLVRRLADQTAP